MRRRFAAVSTCAVVLCLSAHAARDARALGGGTSTIGDRVWLDRDRDGVQDAGEPGVPGVVVELWQWGERVRVDTSDPTSPYRYEVTDSDGMYLFTEVEGSEDTHLVFNLPTGYAFTTKDQGGDDAADSDADATTGETATFLIEAEQVDLTWDAGLTLCSVGDFVWVDDGDGVQESGEVGKKDVVVELLDGSGSTVLATTATDDDGRYLFADLLAGDYRVRFLPPAGYTFASKDQGSDDGVDSDADTGTGVTASFSLTGDDLTRDAGLIAPPAPRYSVGDFVWVDTDANGIQGGSEDGIDAVTVELLDGDTLAVLDTTSTSGGGEYHFNDLLEGDYRLRFTLPTGYTFAPKDQGGDDAKDSDADTTTGTTASFHLDSNDDTRDAGLIAPPAPRYSLGNFVWEDGADGVGNGIQDSGEPGIDGITVELLEGSADDVLATTTTAGGGLYLFTNLLEGDYRVRFALKSGFSFSAKDQGGDDAKDSDADTTSGTTASFHLAGDDMTRDAGMVPPAAPRYSVGDYVWEDSNDNGVQDSGEPALDGITVELLDGTADTVLATTTTSGGGLYEFTNLLEGDYRVRFDLRTGYSFADQDQGGDDAADSDANTSTGTTASFHLASDDSTRDAGLVPPPAPRYTLGDFVWLDNGNGLQDSGEAGVSGVTVQLLDGNTSAVLGTTTTSGSGAYQFTDLLEGDYRVKFTLPGGGFTFAAQDQGSNDAVDSDANVATGLTAPFHLDADDSTRDAGILPPPPPRFSLGDFVWTDSNNNGVQNSGELGIDGLTVQLLDGSGTPLATTSTSGGGKYLFSNLLEGDYRVKFFLKTGYSFSPIDQGGNDALDSDANTTTGVTASFHLNADDMTRDAGMVPPPAPRFSLGDYVWRDLDGDGAQDASEFGVNGVTVQLLGASGSTVLASTTTSGGGKYLFTNLLEGDYRVKFVLPSGYAFTSKDAGGNDSTDSDADTGTGVTATFHLNGNDLTRDAGLVSTGGGHTPGFWQNKNGQALITCSDLTYLRSLCLVNANGSAFDPTTAAKLGTWITSDAVNMAYKLSTFTAAMSLNVRHGFVSSSATVYTGDCASVLGASSITIGNLLSKANAELCTKGHNYTVTNGTIRTYQECIKIVLDRACNNLNWVNP